ncbi:MAG: SUMF1/EgtB/PvdO family nonheme iron enzyme [Deltaproteobacteria bacterium]|nr:SUMF1/EgtB/PvdO family nonheme iron enzyme [Deltaproteobacteria bacterium]
MFTRICTHLALHAPFARRASTAIALAVAALVNLGNAPAGKAPAPPLEPKKDATAATGAALLTQPLDGMVLLPAGSFTMGSGMDEVQFALLSCRQEVLGESCKEYPFAYELWAHTVHLDAFFLDRTEVTVAAYRRCVSAGECLLPAFTAGDPKFDKDTLPVSHVSWEDARRFCAWRGGRLPTEAEWERAARGAAPRRYPWGNLPNPKLANHGALDTGSIYLDLAPNDEPLLGIADASDGHLGLAPVGSFPAGSTPEGLHDLAGNVGEWVGDFWGDRYSIAAAGNPKGPPNGSLRVVRGGSYRHPMAFIRGASRDRRPASAREPTIGFRCARASST